MWKCNCKACFKALIVVTLRIRFRNYSRLNFHNIEVIFSFAVEIENHLNIYCKTVKLFDDP